MVGMRWRVRRSSIVMPPRGVLHAATAPRAASSPPPAVCSGGTKGTTRDVRQIPLEIPLDRRMRVPMLRRSRAGEGGGLFVAACCCALSSRGVSCRGPPPGREETDERRLSKWTPLMLPLEERRCRLPTASRSAASCTSEPTITPCEARAAAAAGSEGTGGGMDASGAGLEKEGQLWLRATRRSIFGDGGTCGALG